MEILIYYIFTSFLIGLGFTSVVADECHDDGVNIIISIIIYIVSFIISSVIRPYFVGRAVSKYLGNKK